MQVIESATCDVVECFLPEFTWNIDSQSSEHIEKDYDHQDDEDCRNYGDDIIIYNPMLKFGCFLIKVSKH